MSRSRECPKCGADISESYESDDWSVGIVGGWYCDACDLGISDDGRYEPQEGDVPIMNAKEARGDRHIGTPIAELSGRPDHPGFAEFCRIAKAWGYD